MDAAAAIVGEHEVVPRSADEVAVVGEDAGSSGAIEHFANLDLDLGDGGGNGSAVVIVPSDGDRVGEGEDNGHTAM